MTSVSEPIIHECFEPQTCTWQYIVADSSSKSAAILDPVLDFDSAKNTITTGSADALLSLTQKHGYRVEKLLETHVHADHLSASKYLQSKLQEIQGYKPDICIGARITEVQARFGQKYNICEEDYEGAFEKLLGDDEEFTIGQLRAKALHLPGHTPDHLGYLIGANVFCGDSLFNADVGSARCDFPGGDATKLYSSVKKLLDLPNDVKIWTGHDYPPGGEERSQPRAFMTVGEQNEGNKHLKKGVAEDEFVKWRNDRDASLSAPKLIHQALQFNIRAGQLPKANEAGDRFLHVPVTLRGSVW